MSSYDIYQSPLSSRYASEELLKLFSAKFKYITWRKLWVSLAKAQKSLGINISDEQIQDLEKYLDNIDFDLVKKFEIKTKHEVMAHILAYGSQAKIAKPIIHLGATSSFVMDNTDLIQYKIAIKHLHNKLLHVIKSLTDFVKKYADLETLSYTHFQSAQPTTVGKRACLWLQDLLEDEKNLETLFEDIPFLGVKGANGSMGSFLQLFEGDFEKAVKLEKLVAKDFGFENILPIASQTYSRKLDVKILQTLSSLASSAHKFATDIRLLSHTKELTEGFSKDQIGSSAMPYKQNPIFSERVCGLSRFIISLTDNASYTHATQWLERSLDDSSNRRLSLPEAFLAADSVLKLLDFIINHLEVHKTRIKTLLKEQQFFSIQEDLLMLSVKNGGDRQKVHQLLKQLSFEVYDHLQKNQKLDFEQEILKNKDFHIKESELKKLLSSNSFFGASKKQCLDFLDQRVSCVLKKLKKTPYKEEVF